MVDKENVLYGYGYLESAAGYLELAADLGTKEKQDAFIEGLKDFMKAYGEKESDS